MSRELILAIFFSGIFMYIFKIEYNQWTLARYEQIDERIDRQLKYGELMNEEQHRKFESAIKGVYREIDYAMKNKNYKLADYYVAVIDEVAEKIMNG